MHSIFLIFVAMLTMSSSCKENETTFTTEINPFHHDKSSRVFEEKTDRY